MHVKQSLYPLGHRRYTNGRRIGIICTLHDFEKSLIYPKRTRIEYQIISLSKDFCYVVKVCISPNLDESAFKHTAIAKLRVEPDPDGGHVFHDPT